MSLTQEEVAEVMTARGYPMSRGRVHQLEMRVLGRLRRDPVIRQIALDVGLDVQPIKPVASGEKRYKRTASEKVRWMAEQFMAIERAKAAAGVAP